MRSPARRRCRTSRTAWGHSTSSSRPMTAPQSTPSRRPPQRTRPSRLRPQPVPAPSQPAVGHRRPHGSTRDRPTLQYGTYAVASTYANRESCSPVTPVSCLGTLRLPQDEEVLVGEEQKVPGLQWGARPPLPCACCAAP